MNTNNTNHFLYELAVCLFLMLSIFYSIAARAIDIKVDNSSGQISAVISNINYPNEILEKELNSGLQNNISVFISFSQNHENIFRCHTSYQITYDLWDEHYLISIISNDDGLETRIIDNPNEVLLLLKRLTVNCGNALSKISSHGQYLLKARVLINPVKAKRIKKIKDWIASSQGYSPDPDKIKSSQATNDNVNFTTTIKVDGGRKLQPISQNNNTSARPRFEKLFDQILQQYSGPNDIASLWSSDVATTVLEIEAVNNEN